MDEDRRGRVGAAGPTVDLLEAARRICECTPAAPRAATAQKLHRIASLLTAFATVYRVDRNGVPIRALNLAELAGAAVGPSGALVYSDGRAPLDEVGVLDASLAELRARLARLGILGLPGD
jgi:hypothetical protein